MFEDPELPDFDSMSQEELIEWLEELTKIQGAAASEFIDDTADVEARGAAQDPDDAADEEWSAWLDDSDTTMPAQSTEPESDVSVGHNFEDEDDKAPVNLARFDERERGPLDAEAMAWLAEISTAETEEKLPEITDYRPPEPPPENLHALLAQNDREDPLEWLDNLGKRSAGPRLPKPVESEPEHHAEAASAEASDDIDDAYEDDETLDDLEDESLYTRRPDISTTVLETIMGMEDRESEEYSTQSMAPVPENAESAQPDHTDAGEANVVGEGQNTAPPAVDGLTQAFLLDDQQVDLEAWYSNRLRAIAAGGDSATQRAPIPALEPVDKPSKPPPPGLAAAIYSARRKVEANELPEALADYEMLLRSAAGLEWVIDDMRALIARDNYRLNPSVHRVLGDALMRQGDLDAALDVYRHALTLL